MTGRLHQLWFGKETEKTVEYWKEQYPQECDRVMEQAERICRNRYIFREHWEMERTNEEVVFGDRIDWEHIPAGDPEWMYAMNRHTSFVILGKAWRLTGNEKYAEKYAELLADWIGRVSLTEESRHTTWRSLEAGIRVENWLRSFLLFENSPQLTEQLKKQAESVLEKHGEYLLEVDLPFHHLSNWGILQNHGLLLLGLYFGREDWRQEAVKRLDEEAYMQVFSDGSQWEQSPMYHCEVMRCLMDALSRLERFGMPAPKRLHGLVHKMGEALGYWCKPDGHMPCQGDSDNIDARDMLAEAAILFGDGRLKAMAQGRFFEDNLWSLGVSGKERYDSIVMQEPSETSKVLTDAGNYMVRSGWRTDADYVKLHCGCMGSGHGHGDLLHVDYYSHGEDILVDAGRYTYVDCPIRKELKHPSGHNTVCVDEEEFTQCLDSWGYQKMASPVKGEYCLKGAVNLISAGHLGYLERGIFAARKVLTLEEGLIVIADVFYGTGRHTYDSRFHFSCGGRAVLTEDGSRGTACVQYVGKRAQAQVLALKGRAEVIRTHCAPEYNRLEESDCMTVRLEEEGQASMLTVISVSDGQQEISVQQIPVKKVRSGEILSDRQAEAVRIMKDGREYVVILCHQELISEVDYFEAGGYASYGRTLVFSQEHRDGICVQY